MKAHRTDLVSFAFGLLFVALSAWWLLARLLGLALPPVGWFLAGALILTGVLGLVGALRSNRYANRDTPGGTPENPGAAGATNGPTGTEEPGAYGPDEADEWSTDAVTDVPTKAVEDRPVSGGGEPPRWSPEEPPLGDEPPPPTDPVTRQDLFAGAEPSPGAEPVTRAEPVSGPPTGEDRPRG